MRSEERSAAETSKQARRGERMSRACVALALSACLAQAVRQTAASAIAKRDTPAALRRAERWDPSSPEIPAQLARALAAQSAGGDPEKIAGAFEAATRLGSHRAENWAALGDALDVAGNASGAKQAYERALGLYPKSPAFNWQFANFLIRQGDVEEATAPLQRSIEGDPRLRMGAFDLAWRAKMPATQILRIVPARQDDRAAYLDYLTANARLDAAAELWKLLLESSAAFDVDAAFRYFDALLAAHRVDELTNIWTELARHDPQRIHWRPGTEERITNGGFDAPLTGGGFGWRVPAVEGADASLDSVVYHDAAPSLCIHFDGKHNLDFGQVAQYAAVQPDMKYDFTAYVRTEGITTDSGPRVAVYDPLDHAALLVETPMLIGTTSWQELELTFRTGPETRIVVVQVLRRPSEKFDNLIGGTMWLDDVSLRAVP